MLKRYSMMMVLLCACALGVAAQGQGQQRMAPAEVEQAVLQLEKDWVEALLKADTAKLETLYADTLIYTHSSGSVDDKAKYIANIKAGGTKYLAIDREDIKASVYGNSAVVTCKASLKLKSNGEERSFAVRMIHIYARVKGQLQMVAHQTTRLP